MPAQDIDSDIEKAVTALHQGMLIAYPTEGVYGLGCDPKQPQAIQKLLELKQRDPDKGLILIASTFEQLLPYINDPEDIHGAEAKASWPGPVTWLWPAAEKGKFSPLLTGKHTSIAVRVTAHPVAGALCEAFNGAIVSTSANRQGDIPARSKQEVIDYFGEVLVTIVAGEVGDLTEPTPIYDVRSGYAIR